MSNETKPAADASPVQQPVRPLIARLRAMQCSGAESDVTVMCAEAADALTELEEWRKLRDPVTLHVSLLRGVPTQLDRATLLHLAGADQLRAVLLKLTNEANAIAEMARPCIGNTKAACLLTRVTEARAALAGPNTKPTGNVPLSDLLGPWAAAPARTEWGGWDGGGFGWDRPRRNGKHLRT